MGVELTLERVVEINDLTEVCPGQLSTGCVDNLAGMGNVSGGPVPYETFVIGL
jgi:hypothetical protein